MEEPERFSRCLFGTDGVRDVANRGLMTPEMALRLGRSYVLFLIERGVSRPTIALGRDTRRSGPMIESALASGLLSAGADVVSLGVIPTPGVSYAVRQTACDGGAVVSASHNPFEYNGIKFLGRDGCKLGDEDEAQIEEYLADVVFDEWRPTGSSVGTIIHRPEILRSYTDWVRKTCCLEVDPGLSLIVDCANGAASRAAGMILGSCFENPRIIADSPEMYNINDGCGVVHLDHLSSKVLEGGCKIGMALDGDADRVLFVDSKGRAIDGDIMLWVLGRWLAGEGRLGTGVVATVMSNQALEEHLGKEGIKVTRCPVGDRYVLEAMRSTDSRLGGEQSGHIIASDFYSTGDGLCSALLFLSACSRLGEDVDTLVDRFGRYPQILRNFHCIDKENFLNRPGVENAIEKASRELGPSGKVLVRPSGTEPLVRVLVEAKDNATLGAVSESLFIAIKNAGKLNPDETKREVNA